MLKTLFGQIKNVVGGSAMATVIFDTIVRLKTENGNGDDTRVPELIYFQAGGEGQADAPDANTCWGTAAGSIKTPKQTHG